jgi:ferredoxin-NADP reductase
MTAAHGRYSRLIYGAIVGLLSAPGIHIGSVYFSPQVAFLVGNLFAWSVSPKGRFRMTLHGIEQIAADCYEFVFNPDRSLRFRAGQYLDWTLHVPAPDNRGNRRPFTIASAPGDDHVRLGVKFYREPSAFKRQLFALQPGDAIFGSQIAGTFTLPRDRGRKLLFIAGGIGITPFRSMIQDLLDRHETRDIVLLYGNRRAGEIAYADLLDRAAREIGLRTVHVISDDPPDAHDHLSGFIDAELIRCEVPDLRERIVYISGPQAMVSRFRRLLCRAAVPRRNIRTDFFPGF